MGTKEYHTLKFLVKKLQEQNTDIGKYQHRVGTIITDRKGNILSTGFNSYIKTHPRQKKYNLYINPTKIFLHAEIDSLVKCRGEPHTMIICRIGRDNQIRLAKPCKGCYNAIKDVQVKKVYFTNNFGELTLLNLDIPVDEYDDYHDGY